ncbi:T9SS type B sorting domain-containing protein [Frigoriflavimonas asaccharolytica]|uniref:Gliding motility-associated-like protein n=1 Tax=Frigoriflavimonas asaccharolytica TaxID=2735899 RepID=A0A8J8G8Y0_9FLAO|nr:gliding motility-associated C-terminal domain-containing protein [Frigoriflavimonas asaccharolytica]NRS93628.1 gliding motility-associated-like protein [Frigoriflavimonas asaccharolytica]
MLKKFIFFLLFITFYSTSFAQLDREHYFAPMIDRTGNPNPFQKIYLSTNRTTPFQVTIFNNNIAIGTVTISKGNPQKFDVARNLIITTQQADLFTPITKGLYVKAEFPFYANLRFSVLNHAEIVTSKGLPSTGTTFYTAMAPITVTNPILNFMTSILATQDNTSVTVSGYSPTVVFSNGTTGATNPTITFTLNKGQSYIIDGSGNIATNSDTFIGAKIVATKPVNVTNGNFNGQYAGNIATASDILMDQSVPVNRLGNEFALVKGNGAIGINMEGAIIVATTNNTQVFLNNETLPAATLNEGQYYTVPDSKYILQGNEHYNLFIRTSQNAYVYQLLAGINNASSVATGGFNFIPSLNCYLPKQIDELGLIDENEVISNGNPAGILNIPTKLNLITETGAVVLVNGTPPPAGTGPFAMTGSANWVTYGIPNVTGNITVNSSKAITAGINAGSDAVGYGGFFAGFPTTPEILTSGGSCAPGITLTVDPIIYDSYQWFLNGNPIPGATSSSFNPTTPGNYVASVTLGSCAPLVSVPFKVLKCLVNSTATYTICTSQNITPAFSAPSIVQPIVVASINIVTPPTMGSVNINPTTGLITYTANNPGVAATDTFTYNFCGSNVDFPECETVTVTILIQEIPITNPTIFACNVNGTGTYNLTTANVTTQNPVVVKYYPTLLDAQTQNAAAEITNATAFNAPAGTIVFALITSPIGCTKIAQITLNFFPLAIVADIPQAFCDDNLDGSISVVLSTITPTILPNSTYFIVKYYANNADAVAGNTITLPNNFTFTATTTIFIRVESPDGCAPVIKSLILNFGAKIPLLINTSTQNICDDNLDGQKLINLSDYILQYTTDTFVAATFFGTLANAQNNVSPIQNSINATGTQTYFIRFQKAGICPIVASITINIKTPKKSDILKDVIICGSARITLDAGPNFESYLWSTGATSSSISNIAVGSYFVDLTFNGCVYRQNVVVSANSLPEITAIDINNGVVTITATGGTPPYEYSLDGIVWQSSNIFNDLQRGQFIAYVRDKLACEPVKKPFAIINLINAITPNFDGINDEINYSDLSSKQDIVFRIFDRYGAEIFRGSPSNRYTWDGKFSNGRAVNTATYWYILEWTEFGSNTRVKYTSWLLVKNRNDQFFKD